MFFDKLSGFIERHNPDLVEWIESTKLFEFPYYPEEVLPWGEDPITQEMSDTFFLPYDAVGVEDNAGLVLLRDLEREQFGMYGWRDFIEVSPRFQKNVTAESLLGEEGVDTQEVADEIFASIKNMMYISFGAIRVVGINEKKCSLGLEIEIKRFVAINPIDKKDEVVVDITEGQSWPSNISVNNIIQNVQTCLEEILFFNLPHRFILETSLVKKNRSKSGRVTRSHNRPKYTLLTPEEIRHKLNTQAHNSSGSSKGAHQRRRHFRTLSHPRFKNKRDQRIPVAACWVGPSEEVVGNKLYRVILDR
jgi:hypothetical protein